MVTRDLALEHKSSVYFTFVDLKKAYYSVPRDAMWVALGRLGVPELTVQLIRSFHQDMRARVRLDGVVLEEISVQNGLRQGYCMDPVLYTCLAVEERLDGVAGIGITVRCTSMMRSCFGGTPGMHVRGRSQSVSLLMMRHFWLPQELERRGWPWCRYQRTSDDFGLTVSIPKTKHMAAGRLVDESDQEPICALWLVAPGTSPLWPQEKVEGWDLKDIDVEVGGPGEAGGRCAG